MNIRTKAWLAEMGYGTITHKKMFSRVVGVFYVFVFMCLIARTAKALIKNKIQVPVSSTYQVLTVKDVSLEGLLADFT